MHPAKALRRKVGTKEDEIGRALVAEAERDARQKTKDTRRKGEDGKTKS